MKKLLTLSCLSLLIFSCTQNRHTDSELLSYTKAVSPGQIEQHVAALSHDSLMGRYPGTPEYQKAMDYVANEFKALGIKPLGDKEGSTYFQPLTLLNVQTNKAESYMTANGDTLSYDKDYFLYAGASEETATFEGELVFAGYGVDAPELGYSDFEQVDVDGKVMVIFSGAPESFPISERAYFSSSDTKLQTAIEKGAVGLIYAYEPGSRYSFERSLSYTDKGRTNVILPNGTASGRSSYANKLKVNGYINDPVFEQLMGFSLDSINTSLQQGILLQPKETQTITGKVSGIRKEIKSANVVGVLEGEELPNEYIVHSGHLDHLGVGNPVEGDSIYNGAQDNAVGISAMIEIARLYTRLGYKPKRSVIFLAVTAEEMGLLGSKFYAHAPTVPMSQIVANVNTDMPTVVAPLLSIEPLGGVHSSLMNQVERTANLLDLRVDEDHMPEQVRFVRSDQLNFILQGVPSLSITYGIKAADSTQTIAGLFDKFREERYHKPSDELDDTFDFEAAKKYVQLQFMVSYFINMAEERPTWNEGDFFARFEK